MLIGPLFWRDFRARLRDRSALVMAILAPAALITVLSLLAAGPDVERIPVGMVRSDTTVATALTRGPLAQLAEDDTITVRTYDDEAGLRAAIDRGRVEAGLVVSDDGRDLRVLAGPDAVVGSAILESVARTTGLTVDGVGQAVAADRQLGGQDSPAALAAALTAQPATTSVSDATQGHDAIEPKTQVAAGMATFFLFFTVQFGVLGLLEERRQGTLPRILAAPVARWQVVASKLLVSFALGLASMAFLLLFSTTLLGAHFGSPLGVALLVVAGVLAAVATVSVVVGLSKTSEQAGAIQSGIALVLGILGGSFFSMARTGGVAAVATKLTPHYWFNEGLVRMTGGHGWTSVWGPVSALLIFAVVVGVPGLLLAGRTVRP